MKEEVDDDKVDELILVVEGKYFGGLSAKNFFCIIPVGGLDENQEMIFE